MKRREWTVQKLVDELVAAADERCSYHTKRLDWWEGERDEANDRIRESGVQVREYAQTGGNRHEVVIDPTLAKRLSECERKITHHRALSDEYAQWWSMLKKATGSFELDHDDWQFFFGLRGDEDE